MSNWWFLVTRWGLCLPIQRRPSAAALAAVAVTLGGCAVAYTDEEGNRHVIGLVDYSVRAPSERDVLAGDVLEVTSIGVSIGQNAQGAYVTAGFNQETTAALRDNAFVLGNPVTALAAAKTEPEKGNE